MATRRVAIRHICTRLTRNAPTIAGSRVMYVGVTANTSVNVIPGNARKKKVAAGLQIRMFNVGEGECVLIVFPNKDAWLMECGRTTGKKKTRSLLTI